MEIKLSNWIISMLSDIQACPSQEIWKCNLIKALLFKFTDTSVYVNADLEIEEFRNIYKL